MTKPKDSKWKWVSANGSIHIHSDDIIQIGAAITERMK